MQSGAKLRLKDFLNKTKIGEVYEFEYPGDQMQAENHVQNMRVHLSRVKKKYKMAKKPFTEFKIMIKEITPAEITDNSDGTIRKIPGVKVVIQRAQPGNLDQHFQEFHL